MAGKSSEQPSIPASIPLPSADLIQYRFDQNDKNLHDLRTETRSQFAALGDKLDALSANFLTKEEAANLKVEHNKDIAAIWKQFETYRWYWRAIVVGLLTTLAGVAAALLTRN